MVFGIYWGYWKVFFVGKGGLLYFWFILFSSCMLFYSVFSFFFVDEYLVVFSFWIYDECYKGMFVFIVLCVWWFYFYGLEFKKRVEG